MDYFSEYLTQTPEPAGNRVHSHMDTWEDGAEDTRKDYTKHTDCHVDYIVEE